MRVIPHEGEHPWPLARSIPRAWTRRAHPLASALAGRNRRGKRQQAEQAYNAYFGQGETPPDSRLAADGADVPPADRTPPGWTQVGSNRWRSDASSPDHPPKLTNASTDGSYQLAAATSPSFWDYWSPQGCASCHGYTWELCRPSAVSLRVRPPTALALAVVLPRVDLPASPVRGIRNVRCRSVKIAEFARSNPTNPPRPPAMRRRRSGGSGATHIRARSANLISLGRGERTGGLGHKPGRVELRRPFNPTSPRPPGSCECWTKRRMR